MRAGGRGRWAGAPAVCLAALVLALALSSCGGDSTQAKAGSVAPAGGSPTAPGVPPAKASVPHHPGVAAKQGATTGGSRCASQLGDTITAMDKLRGRLVNGLAYGEYVGAVKSVLADYEAIPIDRVALGCVRAAGTPAEKALNRYLEAGNVWTGCVEVPSCEAVSIEAELQGQWRRASGYLSRAQHGLAEAGVG